MATRAELLHRTLDLLILKSLVFGPLHGWGVSKRLRAISQDAFTVAQGSLYPPLCRLEARVPAFNMARMRQLLAAQLSARRCKKCGHRLGSGPVEERAHDVLHLRGSARSLAAATMIWSEQLMSHASLTD